ncbi:MAG: hypothetical protein JW938_01195 [Candidatus Omnitrophica bacterium]|nr:hypothetical protein [Candidatus Omnitrophota bacterium]
MRKALSVVLTIAMLALPQATFAASYTPISSATIGASGSLQASTTFNVSVVEGGSLTFNYQGNDEITSGDVVQTEKTVQVAFDDNSNGYQAVIISTDNGNNNTGRTYTGTGSGAGLVNLSNRAAAAPLHWTVFDDRTESDNEYAQTDLGSDAYLFGATIETPTEFFVTDKKEFVDNPATTNVDELANILGYATVIGGVSNQSGTLANAPYNDDDPATSNQTEGRFITDGNAFMRLACNYNGQEAGNYVTDTLKLELVTIS